MTARTNPSRPVLGAFLACLLLLAAGCGLTTAFNNYMDSQDTGLRKRVCLADFSSGIKELDPKAKAWHENLGKALAAQGNLVLVPFDQLSAAMDKVPPEVRSPEERAILGGRALGLTSVVLGQFTDVSVRRQLSGIYGFRDNDPFLGVEAELRMLDVASGTVADQETFRPEAKLNDVEADAIRMGEKPKPAQVAPLLAELDKMTSQWTASRVNAQPWAAYVLEVKGDMAKITVGRDTGLPVGSFVTAYSRGEKIRTGAGTLLYLTGPPLAKLRISDLEPRVGWAKILPYNTENKEPPKVEPGLIIRAD